MHLCFSGSREAKILSPAAPLRLRGETRLLPPSPLLSFRGLDCPAPHPARSHAHRTTRPRPGEQTVDSPAPCSHSQLGGRHRGPAWREELKN
ncbi:hypothetical protein NDU88_009260 [Pleurodeles waltl]|uniref:Uncharacterized protein n=1 Tax=Pleurodeles waltl TaxID=8319 RepID=A0AAV7RVL1_PLEWA|nr:hypothetical protein NDU88_009260 [Pleurodeles waltl]